RCAKTEIEDNIGFQLLFGIIRTQPHVLFDSTTLFSRHSNKPGLKSVMTGQLVGSARGAMVEIERLATRAKGRHFLGFTSSRMCDHETRLLVCEDKFRSERVCLEGSGCKGRLPRFVVKFFFFGECGKFAHCFVV